MFGTSYRVYYLQDGPQVIVLICGGHKSTQQLDIERAHQLAQECRDEKDRIHG